MVLFNYATKEITAKIVYYGPGLCGKTTNLQFIYDSLPSNNKSKMLSLATKTDRTLFFDFLPLDLGKIRGMRTKLQLYTVPGQVYYNSTRQLVLKGADGVVFVADSQDFALDANLESMQNLEDNLKRQGVRIREIPIVIQYNKRDLPNALPVEVIDRELNKLGAPKFESVATTGIGVEEALKGITSLVLAHLIKKYGLEGTEPLDREIQILNPKAGERPQRDELWDEDIELPKHRSATSPIPEIIVEDAAGDENIPTAATELIPPVSPFESTGEAFYKSAPVSPPRREPAPLRPLREMPTEIPLASIEIPLPPGILDSLPVLDDAHGGTSATITQLQAERRATDGLVKEVSIPLNLSIDELRQHRRLRLKITLDVNLIP